MFQDVGCISAKEFVELLSKLLESSAVAPDFRSSWVFRGHGDAGWDLLPTAWRQESPLADLREWIRPKVERAYDKKKLNAGVVDPACRVDYCHHFAGILAEIEAVRQFCQTADELGLSVPNGEDILTVDAAIRQIFQHDPSPLDAHFSEFSKKELFPDTPFIFAQHHGIPTRYLDWTRDPFVAAFFAAEFALEAQQSVELTNRRRSPFLCIWAVKADRNPTKEIRWVTVPRVRHQYLHAQSGLCSVIPFSIADGLNSAKKKWPTLDELLQSNFSPSIDDLPVDFRKINLPVGQTTELLKLLSIKGITRARLMPTLDNVANVTRRHWNFLKP